MTMNIDKHNTSQYPSMKAKEKMNRWKNKR